MDKISKKAEPKKLGIALGAGGARGACHIGFLKALIENNIRPSYIAGCSMGAVVGGCYAASLDIYDIEKVARKARRTNIMEVGSIPRRLFDDVSRLGIMSGWKAEKLIAKFTKGMDTADTLIPFSCVAVDILSAKRAVLKTGDLYLNMRASFAVPIVFEPVRIDDMILVDGSILDRVPAGVARDMGADVVIAMDALGSPDEEKPKNAMGLVYQVIRVMDEALSKEKVSEADLMITPEMPGVKDYSIDKMSEAIDAGYNAAMEHMDKIKALLGLN